MKQPLPNWCNATKIRCIHWLYTYSDREEGRDAAQEVFIRVYMHFPAFGKKLIFSLALYYNSKYCPIAGAATGKERSRVSLDEMTVSY